MVKVLDELHRTERYVVREAFHERLAEDTGDLETALHISRVKQEMLSKDLVRLYVKAGLFTGKHEAKEAIRELRSWADAEAEKHFPGPSR